MKSKWTHQNLQEEALKYKSRSDFYRGNMGAYGTAKQRGCLNQICSHMVEQRHRWTNEELQQEALKYNTRGEFEIGNERAYVSATRKKILDVVCSHMPKHVDQSGENHPNFKWTHEKLQAEALKYTTKVEFQKSSSGAYTMASKHNILDKICQHMTVLQRPQYTLEELQQEALKYKARGEFSKNSCGAYSAAHKKGILGQICSHMIVLGGDSLSEQDLFKFIKSKYPKTTKLRDRKVNIPNKPHIHGFDVDMYIPELRKGIEFDGQYWHSVPGLKRSRQCWPEEDLQNYHNIKDEHFKSKGIELLHIDEKDWLKNQQKCIEKCLEFLGVANEPV